MFDLTHREIAFVGLVLEGFLYGLYSSIFAMYLQYWQASKKDGDKKQNLVFYSTCALYVLSVVLFVSDIMLPTYQLSKPMDSVIVYRIGFIQVISFGCCDFIAQFILIYRCWIVWGCNTRVAIVPSILAFAFLVIWLVGGCSLHDSSGVFMTPSWAYPMTLSSLTLSLTVNALATGLIVSRIFKVFRGVGATLNDEILGAAGGSKLWRIILVLIESSMALFLIQLARVVATILWVDASKFTAFTIITSIHYMLNGITPTLIMVRTSMGLSFHNEEEIPNGSLSFAFNHPNSVPGTTSIGISGQNNRDRDNHIDVQRLNNVDITDG